MGNLKDDLVKYEELFKTFEYELLGANSFLSFWKDIRKNNDGLKEYFTISVHYDERTDFISPPELKYYKKLPLSSDTLVITHSLIMKNDNCFEPKIMTIDERLEEIKDLLKKYEEQSKVIGDEFN